VEFDVGSGDEFQVDGFRALLGQVPHHFGEGDVPVLQDHVLIGGAAVVDVHVDAEVAFEAGREIQRLHVFGYSAKAPGCLAGLGFDMGTHDQAFHPGVVVINQSITGSPVGLDEVFEVGSHIFPAHVQ